MKRLNALLTVIGAATVVFTIIYLAAHIIIGGSPP